MIFQNDFGVKSENVWCLEMFGRKDWESLLRPDKLSVESEFGQPSPIAWYCDRTHFHHTPGARRTSSNACAKCKQSGDTKHGSSGVLKRSVIRSGVWGLLLCWLTRLHSHTHTHTVCSGNFRMLYTLESLESYIIPYISFRIVLALNESIDASTKTYKNVCKSCKSQRSSPFSDSWGSCISSRRLAGFLGASCQLQTFQVTRQAPALQAVNQVHQHLIAPGPTEAYLFILFNAVGIFGWRANQVSWDIFLSWDTKFVLQIDHATMLVSAISALHWASFHVANKETLLTVWRYGVYFWIDLCIALA